MIDKDRKKFFSDKYSTLQETNDVSGIYKLAKLQAGWKATSTPVSFTVNGKKVNAPQQIADIQLDTFRNKTEKLINQLPPPTQDPLSHLQEAMNKWESKNDRSSLSFRQMSKLEILEIINKLGYNNSAAHDELDAAIVKHGASILHAPIAHIVNLSISNQEFATKWKIGRLLPLHKGKGLKHDDPASFRPISLLPVISKITERAIQPQIMDFMNSTSQLNENIHSYRSNLSTTTALLQLSNDMFESCNQNKIATSITIDQSAAFDVLKHQTLLRKLELYGFSESAIKWIKSYLEFRSQYVSIGTKHSRYWSVTNGVPQGSVLGPILYILYVNELPTVINNVDCEETCHDDRTKLFTDNCQKCGSIPTYADDSTYTVSTKTRFEAQEKISENILKIKSFLDANSLSINIGKTEILETMVRQKRTRVQGIPPQLSIMTTENTLKIINTKESCRLLGANLNADMNWKHHLELGEKPALPSVRAQIGILKHISKFMPKKTRLLLANGLIVSKILYLIPMWGGLPVTETRKIQILLNKTARFVTGLSRKTRTRTLMLECNWLYASELVKYHSLVHMWRIVRLGTPYYLKKEISIDGNNFLSTNRPRITLVKNAFKWRTVDDWNDLGSRYILRQDQTPPVGVIVQ